MSNFDWLDYDESPVFKQGIAIVRRNGKFGAVMVGGKEIVPPIYDDLSEFKDGYAVAKWNGEERVVNLSGQVRVLKGDKDIFLPEEYDWGFDFIEDICVVVKNDKYGIIDLDGNKLTTADYSTITSPKYGTFIIGKKFGKHSTLKYGVINSDGCYILEPKYDKITYSEQANCFITNLSYSDSGNYPYETKSNQVSIDGFYLIQGDNDETVLVPTKIADWCDNFSENGLALVIKDGHKGHINGFYQIVAFNENERIVIPEKFDFSGDFKYGFASVSKNNRYGIISTKLEQILSCDYEYIEPLSAKCFKFKKDDLWGVVDSCGNIIIDSKYRSISYEAENFIKVETSIQNGSCTKACYGLYNGDGNLIIQEQCENIVAVEYETQVFVIVTIKNGKQGVYDDKGSKIIPLIYDRIELKEGYFTCHILEQKSLYYSYQERKIKSTNKYNLRGEQILALNEKQFFVVPAEYDLAYSSVNGLIIVIKEGKWGILNQQKDLVVPNIYSYIYDFVGCYAVVKTGDYVSYFREVPVNNVNVKMGLINTLGEVALPLEYEHLWIHKNGYIIAKKDGVYGILCPSLNWIVTPRFYRITKLENTHFVAVVDGKNKLFDYSGHEIPLDDFDEIEILSNGFYKLTRIGNFHLMCVVNSQGKTIIDYGHYEDIKCLDNGLMLVAKREIQGIDINLRYKTVYNLINLQGKELFPTYYEEINFETCSILSVRYDWKWGIVDILGNIIAEPNYKYELDFNLGISSVSVNNSPYSQKINLKGEIIVVDENTKNEVILSSEYYWGTNFINGLCIVRSRCQHVGVIEQNGKIVIPTQYQAIHILSNNVIVAKNDNNNWGAFNCCGSIIMDFVYDLIELQKNSFYAIVKKEQAYGIANLETNEIVLFDKLNINHMWGLDIYGRCIYSKNCIYETWRGGTNGFIDMNEIIIPADKYECFYSLSEDIVAAIYKNGEVEYYKKYEDGETMWAKTDEIIKGDEDDIPNSYKETSVIVLSDEIPKSRSNSYSDWCHLDNSYDDCSSKYGGYNGYDDDTIDSAFEGDPELTWNID